MSWHAETDAGWATTHSANELVLVHLNPNEMPVVTARRAIELLVDYFGEERLKELVDVEAYR